MAEPRSDHGRQKLAAVAPLILVIAAALAWSAFATYSYATGTSLPGADPSKKIPGQIAWTLVLALDGSVVVTTPIWLSTVLPATVRNYAGVICMGALCGSMVMNVVETGLPGLFPPLVAAALIHLVGVVLRAYVKLESDRKEEEDSAKEPAKEPPAPSVPAAVPVSLRKESARPPVADGSGPADVPLPDAPDSESDESSDSEPPKYAMDVIRQVLDAAWAKGEKLPDGPELTEICRKAGFNVNPAYGRTARARWTENHPMAREDVTV